MRLCKKEDFTSRKYKVTANFEKLINFRVCPDISDSDKNYAIKNLYEDLDERLAFSVQILKCKNTKQITCKTDPEI